MQKTSSSVNIDNLISQIIDKLMPKSTTKDSKNDFSAVLEQLLKQDTIQNKTDTQSKDILSKLEELISKQKDTKKVNSNKNLDLSTNDLLNLLDVVQNNAIYYSQNTNKQKLHQKTLSLSQKNTNSLTNQIKLQKANQAVSESTDLQQSNDKINTQEKKPLHVKIDNLIKTSQKTSTIDNNLNSNFEKTVAQSNEKQSNANLETSQNNQKQQENTTEKQFMATSLVNNTNSQSKIIDEQKNTIYNKNNQEINTVDNTQTNINKQILNTPSLEQKQQTYTGDFVLDKNNKQEHQAYFAQLKPLETTEALQTTPTKQTIKTQIQENTDAKSAPSKEAHITATSNTSNNDTQSKNYTDSNNNQDNKLENVTVPQTQSKFILDKQTLNTLSLVQTTPKEPQNIQTNQNTNEEKNQKQLSDLSVKSQSQIIIGLTDNTGSQKLQDPQNANIPKQPYPINHIVEKIIELQNLKPPVIKSIKIQVNPPSLGQIDITVSLDSNKSLNATIHVENQEIFNLVNNNLDSLKTTIAQQGINVAQINVTSNNFGQQNFNQNQNQQNQNQSFFQFNQSFNNSNNGQNSFNQAFNQQKTQNYFFANNAKQIKRTFRKSNALLDISI